MSHSRHPLLLLTAFLVGCSQLDGRFESPHYQLFTDVASPERLLDEAERLHAGLAERFGVPPDAVSGLLVVFARHADFLEAVDAPGEGGWHGVTGAHDTEFRSGLTTYRGPTCVLAWDGPGRLVLAHELTHLFVLHVLGLETPAWLNEGLAYSLSGDRLVNGDGAGYSPADLCRAILRGARVTKDGRLLDAGWLDAQLASIDSSLPVDADAAAVVGGALVRFGLETCGWVDACGVRGWRPDREAFLAWLRSEPRPHVEQFAPLVGTRD